MRSIRLDLYAPDWARGLASDLEAGIAPAEALTNAAGKLNDEAARSALDGIHALLRADRWQRIGPVFVGSHVQYAMRQKRIAGNAFEIARALWQEARAVRRMRGEIVMGSLV